eukprot:GHVU01226535.1.p1 GENE.GHVU01226535.1~~GHVU01226535.1.p1  ORF type:complete len:290 (+),score=62.37 GHVU01226535.1:68-937(+)
MGNSQPSETPAKKVYHCCSGVVERSGYGGKESTNFMQEIDDEWMQESREAAEGEYPDENDEGECPECNKSSDCKLVGVKFRNEPTADEIKAFTEGQNQPEFEQQQAEAEAVYKEEAERGKEKEKEQEKKKEEEDNLLENETFNECRLPTNSKTVYERVTEEASSPPPVSDNQDVYEGLYIEHFPNEKEEVKSVIFIGGKKVAFRPSGKFLAHKCGWEEWAGSRSHSCATVVGRHTCKGGTGLSDVWIGFSDTVPRTHLWIEGVALHSDKAVTLTFFNNDGSKIVVKPDY